MGLGKHGIFIAFPIYSIPDFFPIRVPNFFPQSFHPHLFLLDFRLHLNHPSPFLSLLCSAEMAMGAAVALVAPRRADCKGDTSLLGPLKAGFHGKHPQKPGKIDGKKNHANLWDLSKIWGFSNENVDLSTKNGGWGSKSRYGEQWI